MATVTYDVTGYISTAWSDLLADITAIDTTGQPGTSYLIDLIGGLSMQGTLAIAPPAGVSVTFDGSGLSGSYGVVVNGAGLVDLSTDSIFSGLTIDSGALELGSFHAAGGSGATTVDGGATLLLDGGAFYNGQLDSQTPVSLAAGAVIDLPWLASSSVASVTNANGTAVITETGGASVTLALLGVTYDGATGVNSLLVTQDAAGNVELVNAAVNEAGLNAAITAIDLGAAGTRTETIDLGANITLTSDLLALNLPTGVDLVINGNGHTIDGANAWRGFFAYAGTATLDNLTLSAMRASGGAGGNSIYGGGGGGAGLGGGLFVNAGATVTLNGVYFTYDSAVGGAGGGGSYGTISSILGSSLTGGGAGGGLGGAAGIGAFGAGGGGIGATAAGAPNNKSGLPAGNGIIVGVKAFGSNGKYGGGGSVLRGGGVKTGNPQKYNSQNYIGGFGGGGAVARDGGFGGGGSGFSYGFDFSKGSYLKGHGAAGGFGGGGGGGAAGGGSGGFGAGSGLGAGGFLEGAGPVGGGGLGAGGAVFVRTGGSLILGAGSVSGNSVTGGAAGAGAASAGSALGSGLFVQGGPITLAPTGVLYIYDSIADASADPNAGDNSGPASLVMTGTGIAALYASNSFTGGITIDSGFVDLVHAGAAGTGAITLAGPGTLRIEAAAFGGSGNALSFGNAIDLAAAGTIELGGLAYASTASATVTTAGVLAVTEGATTVSLAIAGATVGQVYTLASGAGISTDVMCFLTGTRIAAARGDVAVQDLRPGEMLRTADGALLPLRWLGRHRVSRRFADPLRVLPVRMRAGALGGGLPCRDLLLSPGHAILLDDVLVHAGALVNGTTILRADDVPEVFDYWHVECDTHALLLAEGVAAESFLDAAQEMPFDNWSDRIAPAAAEELPYPRLKSARQLPGALRQRLGLTAPPPGPRCLTRAA